MGNSESGFSMIETLISMFISLLISAAICLVFVSLYRNIGKVNNEISISREKLVKDKYIREYLEYNSITLGTLKREISSSFTNDEFLLPTYSITSENASVDFPLISSSRLVFSLFIFTISHKQ